MHRPRVDHGDVLAEKTQEEQLDREAQEEPDDDRGHPDRKAVPEHELVDEVDGSHREAEGREEEAREYAKTGVDS